MCGTWNGSATRAISAPATSPASRTTTSDACRDASYSKYTRYPSSSLFSAFSSSFLLFGTNATSEGNTPGGMSLAWCGPLGFETSRRWTASK